MRLVGRNLKVAWERSYEMMTLPEWLIEIEAEAVIM